MEIVIVMFLTLLKIFAYIIEALVILCLLGAVMVGVGLVRIHCQSWLENRKNRTSDMGDYFEESRVPDSFDKKLYDPQSEKYWRELDRLNDEKILENTKDIS